MSKANDDEIFAFLAGMILGMLGGSLLGILYAPKSGDQIRSDVSGFTRGLAGRMNDELSSSNQRTRGFIEKTRYNIENRVGKVRKDRAAGRMAKAKHAEEVASGYDFN